MNNMSVDAALALKALDLRKTCGNHAARVFAHKHGISGLYRLACQLHAVREVSCA